MPFDCHDGECSRPSSYTNTGYYYQVVQVNQPGEYLLSWWARKPLGAVETVDYKIEIASVGGEEVFAGSGHLEPNETEWERKKLSVYLDGTHDIEIEIHPSADVDADVFGDVWLWGVQLERIAAWRLEDYGGVASNVEPLPHQPTGSTRIIDGEYCPDTDGLTMRSRHFERLCLCENGQGLCGPGTEGSDMRNCFWQASFRLNLEGIEQGKLIPSHNVSRYSYNYRHEALAVNLVGSNVRDCSHSETPGTCYSNGFVPYSLIHSGKVSVRNHTGEEVDFYMPTARIEYGKALASEVLVTNPPSSTHSQLLSEYYKSGLRGRPLQGEYTLRIWDVPEFNWDNVEDIQLIWKYRYWTRMNYGD
jgi:hypothetical protein